MPGGWARGKNYGCHLESRCTNFRITFGSLDPIFNQDLQIKKENAKNVQFYAENICIYPAKSSSLLFTEIIL